MAKVGLVSEALALLSSRLGEQPVRLLSYDMRPG